MYNCEYNIFLLTDDDIIEQAARQAEKPEDSSYTFTRLPKTHSVPSVKDSAVIIDIGYVSDDIIFSVPSGVYKVILADKSAALSKEAADCADMVWLTDADKNRLLLGVYFRNLFDILKCRFDKRVDEICLDTAIDSIPDLVWYKDMKGAHLRVNNGFCKAVKKTKEQIFRHGHYYIWDMPKSEYEKGDYVCLESEDIVINARSTVLFDEKVKTKDGMRLFKTYKSPLIDTDGEIIGTCGVAHDVTDLQNTNDELKVVLESVPFAVVVEDNDGIIISANKVFYKYFPDCRDIIGSNREKWGKHITNIGDKKGNETELTADINGEERIFMFTEAPVIDIFGQTIGIVNVFRDVTVKRMLERQAVINANTDFLTGLNNRRSLFRHLDTLRRCPQVTISTIDLDNFKTVNDTYGHNKGDEALKLTSQILCDVYSKDFVARLGGDEFLVVSDRRMTDDDISEMTREAMKRFESEFGAVPEFSGVTASIGVASVTIDKNVMQDIELLMHNSDTALYDAKNTGKSKFVIFGE